MKIRCPFCTDEYMILKEKEILPHLSSTHHRESKSLERTLNSFRQLGILFIIMEDEEDVPKSPTESNNPTKTE